MYMDVGVIDGSTGIYYGISGIMGNLSMNCGKAVVDEWVREFECVCVCGFVYVRFQPR